MGNATSSNKATQLPKKTSHKLSKPPISRYASTTAGLLSSDGCLVFGTARRHNSSNTGGRLSTRPSPSTRPSYSSPAASDIASPTGAVDSLNPHLYRHPDLRQDRPRKSTLPRPNTSQTESREQRRRTHSFDAPGHHSGIRRSQSTANGTRDHPHHYNYTAESSWCTSVNSTYAPDDFRAYQPSRLAHLRESVNMHDYEFAASESKSPVFENTWKNSHPTSPPTSPGLSRANSDISNYAPVRRRSLIRTPGVATRPPSASELARRTGTMGGAPVPHTRRCSIETGPELISVPLRVPDPPQERAVTPRDIDYGHLGAMKFGSLRITNGSPSPTDQKRGKDGSTQGVFGLKNVSDSSLEAEPKERRATRPSIVEPTGSASTSLNPITATLLKLESGDRGQPVITSKDEKEDLASLLPGLNFGSFSFMGSKFDPPALQTTSKHTAVEDDLFEDDSPSTTSDGASTQDMEEIRGRTNRGKSDQAHKAIRQSGNRPDSGLVSSPISETSYKPFSKTDSGYCSNVSVRSLRNSKGSTTDKDLPPFPGEPSKPPVVGRTSSTTLFLGDSRRPAPRLISLDDTKVLALPDQEAPPPTPPPKDFPPIAQVDPAAKSTPTTIAKPETPGTRTKTKKKTAPRPSYLLTSRNRATGPDAPNSVQLSPALSSPSTSAPIHRATVQKPGPLKRFLSATSKKGSFGSLGSRPFRHSGSSSTSRESAGSPVPLRAKLFKDTRSGAGSGLSAMESLNTEKAPNEPPSRPTSPEAGAVRRHRSVQSIPATTVHAAVSALPSHRSVRRSASSSIGKTGVVEQPDAIAQHPQETTENPEDIAERDDGWSRSSSSGSDTVSSEDYTHDTLVRNGFDPSFMAMTSARDDYFSPAPSRAPSRDGSMASRRSEGMRSTTSKVRSNTGSLASSNTRSAAQNTEMVDQPYLSSSHPLMRTRSLAELRVPALLRPHLTPPRLHKSQSQNFSPQPSHPIYSYPLQAASGRSSVDDTRSQPEMQHRPRHQSMDRQGRVDPMSLNGLGRQNLRSGRPGSHSRTESVSSQGSSISPYVRAMSASPYSEGQRLMPRRPSSANPYSDMQRQAQPLRHRASYEGQTPSKPRQGQGYRRQSPNLWTSTHHEQLQMQYGRTALDPRGKWRPPYVPRSGGHYRDRSAAFQGGSNIPYRVLHSYYTPAYRHAPIWG